MAQDERGVRDRVLGDVKRERRSSPIERNYPRRNASHATPNPFLHGGGQDGSWRNARTPTVWCNWDDGARGRKPYGHHIYWPGNDVNYPVHPCRIGSERAGD